MSPDGRELKHTLRGGSEALLGAVLVFCPLALGSAPIWTLWPLCVLAFLSLALVVWGPGRPRGGLVVPTLAWVPAAVVLVCLVQLVPLPPAVLAAVSPDAAALREFSLLGLGLDRLRPISLDAPATWREVAKHLAYLAVFLTSVQLCRSRRASRRLLQLIAALGALLSMIGIGHLIFGMRTLMGRYTFEGGAEQLVTPFGNPNHLAALLGVCATIALSLALTTCDRRKVLGWVAVYLLTGAAILLSLSRGGIVFFFATQLLFAFLLWRVPPDPGGAWIKARIRPAVMAGGVLVAVVAVLAVGSFIAHDKLEGQVSSTNSLEKLRHTKLEFWPMFVDSTRQVWLAGMGRGAFEAAFTRYQTRTPDVVFTHPENILFQVAMELGVPAALFILVLAGWGLFRLVRGRALTVTGLGIVSALVGLVLHDLLDFSLEFPASAVTAAALLGALAQPSDGQARVSRALLGWLPALGLALLALVQGRSSLRSAESEVAEALRANRGPEYVRRVALPLIDLHPADYALYQQVAHAYVTQQPTNPAAALAFVNRVFFLRPEDGPAHLTAARALMQLGRRKQALAEYAAAQQAPEVGYRALDEALSSASGLDELTRLVGGDSGSLVRLVKRLRALNRKEEASALLEWGIGALDAGPGEELRLLAAAHHLEDRHYARSLEMIRHAEEGGATGPNAMLIKASALAGLGDREEAVRTLEALASVDPQSLEVGIALARQWLSLGSGARARAALQKVLPLASSPPAQLRILLVEAQSWEKEGNPARALGVYRQAARLQPKAADLHYLVARSAEASGLLEEALAAVRTGSSVDSPAGARAKAEWLRRLRRLTQAGRGSRSDIGGHEER